MKVVALFLAVSALAVAAQELSPDIDFLTGLPDGAAELGHEFTFSFGRITGKPYSAEETTRSVRVLGDGNRIINTRAIRIYRDAEGRVRREVSLTRGGSDAKRTVITISDPVAGFSYSLDPQTKIARKNRGFPQIEQALARLNQRIGDDVNRRVHDALKDRVNKLQLKLDELPVKDFPMPDFGRPFPEIGGMAEFGGPQNGPLPHGKGVTRTHEDLGTETIAGIEAEGTRDITTIPAGIIGNEKPIVIKSERWIAKDLGIAAKTVYEDPRFGTTEFTITELKEAAPNASLFRVPTGYHVEGEDAPPLAH